MRALLGSVYVPSSSDLQTENLGVPQTREIRVLMLTFMSHEPEKFESA